MTQKYLYVVRLSDLGKHNNFFFVNNNKPKSSGRNEHDLMKHIRLKLVWKWKVLPKRMKLSLFVQFLTLKEMFAPELILWLLQVQTDLNIFICRSIGLWRKKECAKNHICSSLIAEQFFLSPKSILYECIITQKVIRKTR